MAYEELVKGYEYAKDQYVIVDDAVVVAGDLVGDSLYYLLGYSGRTKFINRWGKYIGLNVGRIKTIEAHFNGHSGKTILFAKWSHLLGAAVLFVAGAVKMPYRKFLAFNFLATLPKSLLLILIGYYFGQAAGKIQHYFNYAAVILGILIAVVVVIFVLSRKKSKPLET